MRVTNAATILVLCLVWNGLGVVAAIGAEKSAANAVKAIKKFTTADKVIAKNGVSVDEGGWRIEAKAKRTVRLFEIADPNVENCTILYRAKMKSDSLDGQAYLEMWCRVEGSPEAFSKGLDDSVTGTTDWASCEIPFLLKKGESPDLIKVNVAIEGKGTVWIKDVEVLLAPLKAEVAAEPASKSNKPNNAVAEKPAPGGNAMQLNQQGWMLFQKGEIAEAQKAFERAIAINPRHPAALNGLGQISLMQRKYDQAESYLGKAAASPGASAAWYGLAKLYLLQGKFDKAEKWAKKIVDSGQADEGAKQMLQAARNKKLSDELRQMIEPPPAASEDADAK